MLVLCNKALQIHLGWILGAEWKKTQHKKIHIYGTFFNFLFFPAHDTVVSFFLLLFYFILLVWSYNKHKNIKYIKKYKNIIKTKTQKSNAIKYTKCVWSWRRKKNRKMFKSLLKTIYIFAFCSDIFILSPFGLETIQ